MSVHEPLEGNPSHNGDGDSAVDTEDSSTPLMSNKPTPLPKLQLFILFLIQFSEPIAALVIYPFINQFVRETGITQGDERKTGYYAGVIVRFTIKFFANFLLHFIQKPLFEFRNLCFSLQSALQLCSGVIYQIDLGVDQSYFWVHLA